LSFSFFSFDEFEDGAGEGDEEEEDEDDDDDDVDEVEEWVLCSLAPFSRAILAFLSIAILTASWKRVSRFFLVFAEISKSLIASTSPFIASASDNETSSSVEFFFFKFFFQI